MDFAIVGMDCLLPGADGAEAWIAASRAGRVALSDVPRERWPMAPETVLGGKAGDPDRTPTIRGGFVGDVAVPDGVTSSAPLDRMDPLVRLVLRTVHGALAGVGGRARPRTDLLLANLALPSTGAVKAMAGDLRARLAESGLSHPWLDDAVAEDRFHAGLTPLVVAEALGFDGHVAGLDAACASGLYAVRIACDRLAAGLCDEAVAAAVNRADSAFLFLGFAQLRALSKTGQARPFSRNADGLLVGEGAAAVRLKRLDDALRDGDVVQAVLRGGALGNDGKKGNLLAPSAKGQLMTLRAAWDAAGLDPRTLGYVECHATGTPLGDKTEVDALAALLGDGADVALSSAKAVIGHTVTCAGLAGLIKAVGAVRDGFVPPTPVDELIALPKGFRVPQQAETWDAEERRAAVSAFGFGGTNAHVILERFVAPKELSAVSCQLSASGPLAVVGVARRVVERVDDIVLDAGDWKLPPVEMADLLPQQAAILQVAREALADAKVDPARTASIVGMEVDPRVAAYTLRQVAGEAARQGGREPGPYLDAVAPPITSSRVQGLLPNFVANRLAAALDLQGPSYATSAMEKAGLVALEHASRLLATGQVDAALVGAVDVGGGRREGAVALVVRRLEDAVRDGQVVHAVLGDVNDVHNVKAVHDVKDVHVPTGEVLDGLGAVVDGVIAVRDRVMDGKPWLVDRTDAKDAKEAQRTQSQSSLRALRIFARFASPWTVASGSASARPSVTLPTVRLEGSRTSNPGKVAFVFPGAGSAWLGMGRDLLLAFPRAFDRLESRTPILRSQTFRDLVDGDLTALLADPVAAIWSSAWISVLLADVLRNELGVRPDASIGYSLGESSGLVALGAWSDVDELYRRITTSPLFRTGLAGPMTAVRAEWDRRGIAYDPARPFVAYVAKASRADVEKVAEPGVSVLIVNHDDEVVVGGPSTSDRARQGGPSGAVERTLDALGAERFPSPFAAAVHCPEVAAVADEYRALHHVTTSPVDVPFYSSATGEPYAVTADSAADAIVSQATTTVDFPRVIRRAYDDGVRVFVEVGPRAACTRWIGRILHDLPHVAVATNRPGAELEALASAVETLWKAGVDVDTSAFEPKTTVLPRTPVTIPRDDRRPPMPTTAWTGTWGASTVPAPRPRRNVVEAVAFAGDVSIAATPLRWDAYVRVAPAATASTAAVRRPPSAVRQEMAVSRPLSAVRQDAPAAQQAPSAVRRSASAARVDDVAVLADALGRSTRAMADAHEAFLDGQRQAQEQLEDVAKMLARLVDGVHAWPSAVASRAGEDAGPHENSRAGEDAGPHENSRAGEDAGLDQDEAQAVGEARPIEQAAWRTADGGRRTAARRSFDRRALERFAAGKLSDCLGPAYADLDVYEPRTRLPTDPLLLVSRVLDVEGERGTLGPSRCVTEYDIPVDAWWSHDGKAPPCVVVESGQADLFLVSYLGIDEICRGKRLYRLLDCDLTFHGSRPRLGETLRHDIRIKRFARVGDKTLFYFEYDATAPADGRPVLTMRNGCAGFFTPAELAVPQGVKVPEDVPLGTPPSPVLPGAPRKLTEAQVEALTEGRYSAALGPTFAPADGSKLSMPRAPWRTVHRVTELRLDGGPHGLGRVVAEQDLRDDDWFNACHFQGDPCMPGTLMFDGCTQALQLWLIAMGFPAEYRDATFEPVAERTVKLRCRGQVVPGHRKLVYDVRIKEAGVEPTPWVVADVVLSVDGTPVVLATDVNLRIDGVRTPLASKPATATRTSTKASQTSDGAAQTVDRVRVLEFSVGDPSKAFGPAFAPFDRGLAHGGPRTPRMPGPPYLTMTRVEHVDGEPGVVAADRSVRIAYDVPPDAWYFQASPGTGMPLGVLLEVALQPCGWLTAWQHTALQLGGDVYFRNLGGTGTQHRPVHGDVGTLVTTARQTAVSRSGGMTIHRFAIEVRDRDGLVYEATTEFGYFTADALKNQKGLQLPADEEARRTAARAAATETIDLTDEGDAPVVDGIRPRTDLRMLDRVSVDANGGLAGLGFWSAEKDVDPREWFFVAHFHEDPVMPGSLGIEALAQLAREAWMRAHGAPKDGMDPVALGVAMTWKYRGQVPPTRKKVGYELDVLDVGTGERPRLVARGLVRGDGMAIYEVPSLAVEPRAGRQPSAVRRQPGRDEAVAALIDRFDVEGDRGHGVLRLDPAVHPWLRDHCPTVVTPAVPMAFAAEIAAEAASLLRPGRKVVAVPTIEARKWIAVPDGPYDLLVDAEVHGEDVVVKLQVHQENPRFPKLSGPVVHMQATVRLGDVYEAAPAVPERIAGDVPFTARQYYDEGHTFHGPVLQGMTSLDAVTATSAEATFRTRPDGDLVRGPAFVLDPLLLDVATHPMLSATPERWVPGLAPGKLAYPVRCDGMRFFGPRPQGDVRCRLDLVQGDARAIAFDVVLVGADGPWCAFRWTEALVDGGPILGKTAAERLPFVWRHEPVDTMRIGRPVEVDGAVAWEVREDDLVEPLPGTLLRLYGRPAEIAGTSGDDAVALIAAKEACREWLRGRLRDVHPTGLELVRTRADRFVVAEAPALTAQEIVDHLGPTRFDVTVRIGQGSAIARVVPRSSSTRT